MFFSQDKQKIGFVNDTANSIDNRKNIRQSRILIVNAYTFIAALYCGSSAILFYYVVQNIFLAIIHLLALIIVLVNYIILIQTERNDRATNIILATGTLVVLSLFATGGWANTGYLWPFAYLPFAFFLSDKKDIIKWVAIFFGGCLGVAILDITGVITVPYSAAALINYFAALLIFTICIFLFRQATVKREEFLSLTETLLEAAPDAVIAIDEEGKIVKWNPKSEALFGWTSNEILGKLLGQTVIPHRYRNSYEKGLKHFVETGEGLVQGRTMEIRALNKTNDEFDVSVSISLATSQDKNLFIGFIRDITERKKTEEKIKESELIFSTLFYKSPVMKAIVEVSTGKYVEVNNAFVDFFGYTKDEILGKTSLEINMPYTPGEPEKMLNNIRKTGFVRDMEIQLNSRDGKARWVSTNVDTVNLDGKDCFLSAGIDITARKLAEEKLLKFNQELEEKVIERTEEIKSSENRYRYLFENNPMPMWVIDLHTFKFLDVNKMAVLQYGYSREEFLSLTALDIRPDEDKERFKNSDHSFEISSTNYNKGIWNHRKKDGTVIQVEIIGQEIIFEGAPARFILSNDITERIRAVEKLNKSEKLFRAMIEKDTDMKILATSAGEIFYASPSLTKILGYDNEELMSTRAFELIHPNNISRLTEELANIIQTPGKSLFGQQRLKHKNGKWLWCEGTITNMLHEPAVAGLVSNFRDITERKILEEQQMLFASIVDSSDDAIFTKTLDGKITSWNHGAEKVYGYSAKEIIGHPFSILVPSHRLIEENKMMDKILAGESVDHYETLRIKKDGKIIYVSLTISPIKDSLGNIIGASKISRDITDKKKTEESLRIAEASYREIFDKANDAIYVHEIETGKVVEVNQIASKITGFTKEELLTNDLYEFINANPDYKLQQAITYLQKAAAGEPQLFEWQGTNKDGSINWFEVSLKKATIAGKERILAFFHEINDRKKAEFEIQQLNEELEQKVKDRTKQLEKANKELEAFSYSVSHDLRAPLRAINGFAKILGENYNNIFDNEGVRLLNRINENAKRMGLLIDDLLEFSRIGRKEIHKSPVEMTKLFETTLTEINTIINHKAEIKIHQLHSIDADSTMIKQVLINLLSNAIKYSSKTEKPYIEIKSHRKEREVIYSVSDNGVGFNNQYAHKLFGVFQRLHLQADFEGTGVGLALVKRIIHKHGGRVWASGELNRGATFFFCLPATNNN